MPESKATISRRRRERAAAAQQWTTFGDGNRVWSVKEVAAHFGVSPKTVYEWLADPDASKARDRRGRYVGACPSCGAPTSPPAAGDTARSCRKCAHPPDWTPESVVSVLRAARDELGRVPTSLDFHRGKATRRGPQAVEFCDRFPLNSRAVASVFGSWPAAIAAAFAHNPDESPTSGGSSGRAAA